MSFKKNGARAFRVLAPTLVALSFAGVAHAQGTMDFSGAQTLMGTFKTLIAAKIASPKEAEKRARAIYSAIVGAQLMARSRADIALYDSLIENYRTAGLLPA